MMFGMPVETPQLYSSNGTLVLSGCLNAGNIGRAVKEAGKLCMFCFFSHMFFPKMTVPHKTIRCLLAVKCTA